MGSQWCSGTDYCWCLVLKSVHPDDLCFLFPFWFFFLAHTYLLCLGVRLEDFIFVEPLQSYLCFSWPAIAGSWPDLPFFFCHAVMPPNSLLFNHSRKRSFVYIFCAPVLYWRWLYFFAFLAFSHQAVPLGLHARVIIRGAQRFSAALHFAAYFRYVAGFLEFCLSFWYLSHRRPFFSWSGFWCLGCGYEGRFLGWHVPSY